MSKLLELEQKLSQLEQQKIELQEKIKPFQQKLNSVWDEIKTITTEISKEKLNSDLSEQDYFDFVMFENGYSSDMIRYKAAQKLIQDLGLFMNGYCQFSNQRMADVFIYRNDINYNNKTIQSLKKLVPLFKPMDQEGNKYFSVFCKDYRVFFTPDNKVFIKTPYYKYDFETIEELFEYFTKNLSCCDEEEPSDD